MIELRRLEGINLSSALMEIAQLRIEVFREWPYLYQGDLDYERRYLQPYVDSEHAIVIGVYDGDRLVGVSTGTPMVDHSDDFAAGFAKTDYTLEQIFYCAESILLPPYRGKGIGHRFFDAREAHAKQLGFRFSAFCAVERGKDHPARPSSYRPLDGFWRSRGYAPLPEVIAHFAWKDIDDRVETVKPMQFWIKSIQS